MDLDDPRPLDDLTIEEHADKLIAEFNIYVEGARDSIIDHLIAAADRTRDHAYYNDDC